MGQFAALNWEEDVLFLGEFKEALEVVKVKSGKEPMGRKLRLATKKDIQAWNKKQKQLKNKESEN